MSKIKKKGNLLQKKIVTNIVFLLIVLPGILLSQNNKPSSSVKEDSYEVSVNKKIFSMALKNGDYTSATNAAYNIIVRDSSAKSWQDSLCSLYFAQGASLQCIQTGLNYLVYSPNNLRVLTMIGFSEKNIGQWKDALVVFENIYSQTKDLLHLYQVAELQFLCKRYGECESTIEALLKAENNDLKIAVSIGGQSTQQQVVPYRAAVLNLKGVLLNDLNQKPVAAACFQEAVKIFPDFILAQNNLKMITQNSAAPSQVPSKAGK